MIDYYGVVAQMWREQQVRREIRYGPARSGHVVGGSNGAWQCVDGVQALQASGAVVVHIQDSSDSLF